MVATVWARDADMHTRLEYFILDGDPFNQFAISADGKVYTRLMIDRETRSHYELEIGVFDGKYHDQMKLRIFVLDVSDLRPECGSSTSVSLDLYENLDFDTLVYSVHAQSLEKNVTRLK